jgi:hypothetical protein
MRRANRAIAPPAASNRRAGCLSALPLGVVLFVRMVRLDCSEHHNAFGIDRERFSGAGVGQPCELHDRPARRVDDESLDGLGFAFHATALAGQEGDLGYRCHDVEIQGGVGDVAVAGYGVYGLMAAVRM